MWNVSFPHYQRMYHGPSWILMVSPLFGLSNRLWAPGWRRLATSLFVSRSDQSRYKCLIYLSGIEPSRRRRVGKVYKLYQHIKRDCGSPRLGCQAPGSPRWELGSFQKCFKQLKRTPSLLSGLRWVLLSWRQVQTQEGGYHHPHGNQSAWSRSQLMAGCLPTPTSPTSQGILS